MLIKLEPIEDALRKNLSKLGFTQSPEPQPRNKHFPKTKLKKKTTLFTPEYFLKLIIKDLFMPHTSSNLPHDFMLEIESRWKSNQLPPFALQVVDLVDDMNPIYLPCQFNKTNAQNPMI
jgi:hypothetical protein